MKHDLDGLDSEELSQPNKLPAEDNECYFCHPLILLCLFLGCIAISCLKIILIFLFHYYIATDVKWLEKSTHACFLINVPFQQIVLIISNTRIRVQEWH